MISLRKEANVVFNFKFISVLITIQMNYIKLTNNPIVNLSKQIKVTEKGGGGGNSQQNSPLQERKKAIKIYVGGHLYVDMLKRQQNKSFTKVLHCYVLTPFYFKIIHFTIKGINLIPHIKLK